MAQAVGFGARGPDLDPVDRICLNSWQLVRWQQVAVAVENALAFKEIADLKDKLAKEKLYLEEELRTALVGFSLTVGFSRHAAGAEQLYRAGKEALLAANVAEVEGRSPPLVTAPLPTPAMALRICVSD